MAVSFARADAAGRPARPHVVLILADDLGWGDIGCHGGPTPTPHIDRLFGESVQLTSFLVTPLCSPTRAALMTGRHPARTGLAPFVVNPKTPATIQPEEVTLGEAFRASGYTTACFGKWHLGFVYSTRSHGFEEFVGCMAGGVDYFKRTRPTNPNELDWQRNGEPYEEEGYTTDLIRDRAVRYIRAADPSRPFFLYVPFTVIRTPRWKLIRRTTSRELYDIHADPAESHDVAARHPELVAELEAKLDAWERSVPVLPTHRPVPLTAPARAQPGGDVLELRVRRAETAREIDSSLPIVLAAKPFVLAPGDRLEYDMYIAPGSADTGFFLQVQTGLQDRALDEWRNAVDQHGSLQAASVGFPQARGQWARRVVGLGSKAPTDCGPARIMFYGREAAEYRLYVDNILVRRADGTTVDLYRDGEYKRRINATGVYPEISIKAVSLTKVPTS